MGSVERVPERTVGRRGVTWSSAVVASTPVAPADVARAVVVALGATAVAREVFRGSGGLVMWGPVQTRSIAVVAGMNLVAVAVLTVPWRRLAVVVVATQVAATVIAALMLRDLAGRAAAVAAITVTFAAHATIVGWRFDADGHRRHTVWTAVPPLVAAVTCWMTADLPAVVVALGALTLAVHAAHLVSPVPDAVDATIAAAGRRTIAAGVAAFRSAVTATTGAVTATRSVAAGPASVVARALRRLGLLRAGIGVTIAAAVSPLLWRMWGGPGAYYLGVNDYTVHGETFRELQWWPFEVTAPHFLFHLVGRAVAVPLGERPGAVLTLAVAAAATYVAWTVAFAARSIDGGPTLTRRQAAWFAVLPVVVETPTVLAMWAGVTPPDTRFMTIQLLYSPTWVASLPLWLAAVWMATGLGERLRTGDTTGWAVARAAGPLSAVVALGVLAKPALALCLLPALPLHLRVHSRTTVADAARATLVVAAPAVAIMSWQAWFMSGSELWANGFTFDPIAGPVYGWRQCGWWFWVPFAWVAIATIVTRGRWFREPAVRLSAWCFVVSVPIFTLFRETGERAQDGNLGLPAQVSAVLLIGLALRSCGRHLVGWWTDRRSGAASAALVTACGAMFVAAGLVALLDGLDALEVPISWYPFY